MSSSRTVATADRDCKLRVRAPAYLVLTAWWVLVGAFRAAGRLLAPWYVPDLTRLGPQAAADGLLSDHAVGDRSSEGSAVSRVGPPLCTPERGRPEPRALQAQSDVLGTVTRGLISG
jgi:hypothetical protein